MAINLNQRNAVAANNLASSLAEYEGILDEALTFAKIAGEVGLEDPSIADNLDRLYYQKGFYDGEMTLIE